MNGTNQPEKLNFAMNSMASGRQHISSRRIAAQLWGVKLVDRLNNAPEKRIAERGHEEHPTKVHRQTVMLQGIILSLTVGYSITNLRVSGLRASQPATT